MLWVPFPSPKLNKTCILKYYFLSARKTFDMEITCDFLPELAISASN